MTNNDCLITLVVPVYNTERFLRDCFESLLDQDLSEDQYEIMVVNDGSTDSCPEIIEEYASKHKCFTVINQENQGQSAARNNGLYSAKGRYVWFVDSDDIIDTNSLGFITKIMDEHQIDELTVGLDFIPEDSSYTPNNKTFTYQPEKIDQRATCSGVKIFRRSIIIENSINWDGELKLSDDVLFIYQFSLFSKKNVYLSNPQYHYRKVANSTSHAKTEAVLNKHLYSLERLSGIYLDIKNNPPYKLSPEQEKELDDRISLCVQTVLYDVAIKGDKEEQKKFLASFKEKGLYPYKPLLYNLKPKISLKRTVYDFLMFFIPFEPLYRFIGFTMRTLRNLKIRNKK